MELPKSKYYDLKCYWTWMGEDGIARTKVKPGAEIELSDAEENTEVVNGFEGQDKFPIIVDTAEVKSMTKDARDHFSLRGRESKVSRIAIIRDSALGNMVANFFIGLNNPTVPVKLFSNESEARSWCKNLK